MGVPIEFDDVLMEIDAQRGVIYVHDKTTGATLLRLCSLPKPIPNPREAQGFLDITHMYGTNWDRAAHL